MPGRRELDGPGGHGLVAPAEQGASSSALQVSDGLGSIATLALAGALVASPARHRVRADTR